MIRNTIMHFTYEKLCVQQLLRSDADSALGILPTVPAVGNKARWHYKHALQRAGTDRYTGSSS